MLKSRRCLKELMSLNTSHDFLEGVEMEKIPISAGANLLYDVSRPFEFALENMRSI
jgi:hypothetical protein